MSNLRQAAQDVLELVEGTQDNLDVARAGGDMGISPVLTDKLRAALAEPERKPLTDEEMRECAQAMNAEPLAEGWPELIKFARAIERAHGITGETNV